MIYGVTTNKNIKNYNSNTKQNENTTKQLESYIQAFLSLKNVYYFLTVCLYFLLDRRVTYNQIIRIEWQYNNIFNIIIVLFNSFLWRKKFQNFDYSLCFYLCFLVELSSITFIFSIDWRYNNSVCVLILHSDIHFPEKYYELNVKLTSYWHNIHLCSV